MEEEIVKKRRLRDNPAVAADYAAAAKTDELGLTKKSKSTSSGSGKSAAVAGASSLAQGGSPADAASGAMIASGNPYAIAGALAIQTLSARRKRLDADNMNQYKADVSKKQRVADMLSRMAQQSSNLGLA